jgi:hypothetical protein
MTYELTSLGTTEASPEELWEEIGRQRAEQAVEMVQAREAARVPRWLVIGLGLGAGWLIGRWLKRRGLERNPMPWHLVAVTKRGDHWVVLDDSTGEAVGYVLKMDGHFAALTPKQAIIGSMPNLPAAAGLVYGRFWEKFGGADTIVDMPASNPDYRIDIWAPKMGRIYVGSKQVGTKRQRRLLSGSSSRIRRRYFYPRTSRRRSRRRRSTARRKSAASVAAKLSFTERTFPTRSWTIASSSRSVARR